MAALAVGDSDSERPAVVAPHPLLAVPLHEPAVGKARHGAPDRRRWQAGERLKFAGCKPLIACR
ncbi:MAG TPA: hypothetical protein VEF89_32240 [Solirubrobacteraceae bacterium]|nr:hypothetical protein [Solirubrobacteraceae bacterium]